MKCTKIIAATVAAVCACWFAAGVFAQRGPRGPIGPGGPPPMPAGPIVKAGTTGLFVLMGGTLLKYDAATLVQAGSLELLTKTDLPAPPGGAPADAPLPLIHGQMIVSSANTELILIVIADKFFSVDAATLQVVAKSTLPKPEPRLHQQRL